jgi:hypothetical protein
LEKKNLSISTPGDIGYNQGQRDADGKQEDDMNVYTWMPKTPARSSSQLPEYWQPGLYWPGDQKVLLWVFWQAQEKNLKILTGICQWIGSTRLEAWLKQWSSCLWNMKPGVQNPVLQKNKIIGEKGEWWRGCI